MSNPIVPHSFFTDFDIDLFSSGHHTQLYDKLGSHITNVDGDDGVYFAVYAPSARKVEVIGDFNYWNGHRHELNVRWDGSGIWEGFIPNIGKSELYKYRIYSHHDSEVRDKTDPFARKYEVPPKTASVVWTDDYEWSDIQWRVDRANTNTLASPMSIYEMHIGSWRKQVDSHLSLSYRELAVELVKYITEMGFTHVEFMPVMEHPYYPSWGYLSTGYFAPSSRFGDPEDLKYLIDELHNANIGVILDWVPAHFPSDEFALANFDGSALYEHPQKAKGFHPDWNSFIFNFERPQVRSFLLSSAQYWKKLFHADGLRVDAVASMLYLDYSRKDGEWSPNMYGGNEYLAAVDFVKDLNKTIYDNGDGIQMIAEESTAFPGVTSPVHDGGLGFGLKWMMGWMNDTLEYFERDPIHRKYHQGDISRSLTYAFSENYVLPLSHDEVVHGKQPLIYKMPGDEWQKFANLRLLYMYMYAHPGQKLLFMGCEIGQTTEWDVNGQVPWHLLDFAPHRGIQRLVKELNKLYKTERPFTAHNYSQEGFEWIDYQDAENSILVFMRKSQDDHLLFILNFSPVTRDDYRIGVPDNLKAYSTLLNSDESQYCGSGYRPVDKVKIEKTPKHGRDQSVRLNLPPLAGIILKPIKK